MQFAALNKPTIRPDETSVGSLVVNADRIGLHYLKLTTAQLWQPERLYWTLSVAPRMTTFVTPASNRRIAEFKGAADGDGTRVCFAERDQAIKRSQVDYARLGGCIDWSGIFASDGGRCRGAAWDQC
jgi:hypothetical protein